MAEEYSFPGWEEKIKTVLDEFGGEVMTTYHGKDITVLHDSSGGMLTSRPLTSPRLTRGPQHC